MQFKSRQVTVLLILRAAARAMRPATWTTFLRRSTRCSRVPLARHSASAIRPAQLSSESCNAKRDVTSLAVPLNGTAINEQNRIQPKNPSKEHDQFSSDLSARILCWISVLQLTTRASMSQMDFIGQQRSLMIGNN